MDSSGVYNLYPYHLTFNPFPSAPTPSINDARILGGKKHIDAKNSINSCVTELLQNVSKNSNKEAFRIITIIQDVGSGKTHLTLHIKISDLTEKAIFSYIDLSKVYPKTVESIYQSMINGFEKEYIETLRKQLLYYILDKSKEDKKLAKKIFKLGLLELLSGKGVEAKALECVENKIEISINDIDSLFIDNFSASEITIIKKIIQNRFEAINSITLLEMINRLALLSRLNLLLFKKISIFQFDELDNENNTLAFIKSMINTHLPDTILMMNMTPSSYHKISRTDSSIYDRLEKANFKIELVGSNSFDEISDIVLAYIFSDKIPNKQQMVRNQLITILKVLYEDFDFRNIRSILNIMHAAFEIGLQKGLSSINEDCIHESLKIVYPGMKIKGSIMNISISEYIKIKSYFNSCTNIEDEIVCSIRSLLDSLEENKSPINNENFSKDIDISYSKLLTGSTSANTNSSTTMLLEENVSNNYSYISVKNKQNKFDALPTKSPKTPKIFLDNSKIIDLLYYYYKVKKNINTTEDDQKALILAKALKLK